MYALIELAHGTVLKRFENRQEAGAALERLVNVPAPADEKSDPGDFGVVEFDDETGRQIGEPMTVEALSLF